MYRIVILAALAAFAALAIAATLTTQGGGDKAPAHVAATHHAAPSHSRAFWVAQHKQP